MCEQVVDALKRGEARVVVVVRPIAFSNYVRSMLKRMHPELQYKQVIFWTPEDAASDRARGTSYPIFWDHYARGEA